MDIDLDRLDDAALDQLPFGVIGVGEGGVVVRYNRAEASRSGMSRWRVLGRALDELARAMAARELVDRVRAFTAAAAAPVGFRCAVTRRGRDAEVDVVLRRGAERIYVCIAPAA